MREKKESIWLLVKCPECGHEEMTRGAKINAVCPCKKGRFKLSDEGVVTPDEENAN